MADFLLQDTPDCQEFSFPTWEAYVTACETRPPCPGASRSSHEQGRGDWHGTDTWGEALKLARDGYKEGTERVRNIARRLETRIIHRIVREDVRYDVEGMGFDIARYLDGEPEHWVQPEESTFAVEGQRHVKIEVSVSVSCGIGTETIARRGAAIAAAVELLEFAGTRVELWTVDAGSGRTANGEANFIARTRVKAYDQPLDMSRVAFALVNAANTRRLHFALQESTRHEICVGKGIGTHAGAYGYPTDAPKHDDTSVYLPAMVYGDPRWASEDSAEAWILSMLAEQGVVLADD